MPGGVRGECNQLELPTMDMVPDMNPAIVITVLICLYLRKRYLLMRRDEEIEELKRKLEKLPGSEPV